MKLTVAACMGIVLGATAIASVFAGATSTSHPHEMHGLSHHQPKVASEAELSQGVYFMHAVGQYSFIGEWTQVSKHGMTHWQPVGPGSHVLELVYDDETVSLAISPTGEVLQHTGVFFVDFLDSGRYEIGEVAGSAGPASPTAVSCSGSYSMVRSVTLTGDC